MMRWVRGQYEVELADEPAYSFGSSDNPRSYGYEVLLETDRHPHSKHAVRCLVEGEPRGSAVLGASGGPTGIHKHSCVLVADRCLVAIGDRLVALRLPDLGVMWHSRADDATVFGVHATLDEKHVVVHGELTISRFTLEGIKEWEFAGQDVFTGECALSENVVRISDFNGTEYSIDLEHGRGRVIRADNPSRE